MTPESDLPPGTPVYVKQTTARRGQPMEVEIVGVVETWEELPTGSWYVDGKKDKLWLKRLKLRKLDGEITILVIDDGTSIAKLETART